MSNAVSYSLSKQNYINDTFNTNANANTNANTNATTLDFSNYHGFNNNNPQAKGWFSKKVLPVIRKVGNIAGKISDISGKVATVASIL